MAKKETKAAIKREKSRTGLDSSGREQARRNSGKSNRTLDALRRAIGTTDGTDCSAFWLWASNDGSAGATAAIGDGDRLASALLALLNRVGEGRAMPQEMMLTRAVLMAVAPSVVRIPARWTAALLMLVVTLLRTW